MEVKINKQNINEQTKQNKMPTQSKMKSTETPLSSFCLAQLCQGRMANTPRDTPLENFPLLLGVSWWQLLVVLGRRPVPTTPFLVLGPYLA